MANNNLKISVVATLNTGLSIGEINSAISGIEKKIKALKLKVEINDGVLSTLNNFAKQMEKVSSASLKANHIIQEANKKTNSSAKEEIRTVEDLTERYKKLTNEVNKYSRDGKLKSTTSTFQDEKGNARVINTNAKGDVTGYKDLENYEKLRKEQSKLRKSLVELAKTGRYTTEELRKIGQGINMASTIKQLDNLKNRMSNMKMGNSLVVEQEKLTKALKKTYDQGVITEQRFQRFNSMINSAKNVAEIEKIQKAMNRVSETGKNKNMQQNLLSQANGLLGSGSRKLDTAGVQSLITSLQSIRPNAQNATRELNNLQTQLRGYQDGVRVAGRHTQTFGDMMSQAFTKFPIWMIASSAFFAPIQGLNKLIETLYVLDERLVSINKVLENADMSAVFENATQAAETYGQKIDSVLESLGEISKLGFNQQDAEFLNNQSMLLSTVGEFRNNADAANYLVAIMRQYKLEVEDTAAVVDALNHVSNKTGADTTSLAQGLSKASSSAAMAEVSFHELNGMIANTQEVLKISGNEAGTFYKTLFTRFLRPKTQSMLESVGIATKDMNGELLSATVVLQNLGEQWDKYDSQTQNAIASQLGGVWHVNKVTSLLENQDNVLKNTEFSLSSYGSATTELETFQEGLQYQTNQMIASFQELGWTLGEVGVRDFLLLLVEGATNLTKGFTELTKATDGWNIKLPLLAVGIYGTVKAIGALRLAGVGLKASFGWIGLGVVALETLASVFMKSSTSSTESAEAFSNNAKQMSDQTKQLEYLISKYDELSPLAEDNKDKQEELQTVLSEIQRVAPHLIESTGKYGDALYLNKQKADEYIESLKAMTVEQVQQAKLANDIELANVNVDIDEEQKKLDRLDKKVKDTFENISSYQGKYEVTGLIDAEKDFNERLEVLQGKYSEALEDKNSDLVNKISQQLSDVKAEYDQYIQDMETSDLGKYSETFGNIEELEAQRGTIEERQKALDEVTSSTKKSSSANRENADSLSHVAEGHYEAAEGMEDSGDAASEAAQGADDYTDALTGTISATEIFFGVTGQQVQQIQNAINVYRALAGQANLTAYQQGLLTQATGVLGNAFPYLNGKIDENIDWMATQAKVMGKVGEISGDEATTLIANQNESTRVTIAGINSRIQGYKDEAAALIALMDTLAAEMEVRGQTGFKMEAYNRAKARLAELQGLIAEANTELGNIVYQDAVDLGIVKPDGSDVGGGSGGSGGSDNAADEAARQKEQAIKDIISIYKDTYKMMQEVAIDGINKEKEAFEQAHEEKMKKLDDQLKLYEDIINKQIESIDKQEEEYNWNKRLSDSQSDRQDIIDEMNTLQLDNSFSAKKRMDELRVRLAEIDSGISDMQHEREVELRKDNLQQLSDDKRLWTEEQKNTETSSFESGLANFDKRMAEVTRYYDNLMNNERLFQYVASLINSGDTNPVSGVLEYFATELSKQKAFFGEELIQNFLDAIQRAKGMLGSKNYGGSIFPSFDTGGYTGSFGSQGKLAMLHEKEIVLNKMDTSNFLKAIDLTRNFFKGVTMPKLPSLNSSIAGGGSPLTIQFNVAKMTGSKDDVNFFMNQIVKGVNSMGGKL
jgi:TP901 family phage tail tape measure protein